MSKGAEAAKYISISIKRRARKVIVSSMASAIVYKIRVLFRSFKIDILSVPGQRKKERGRSRVEELVNSSGSLPEDGSSLEPKVKERLIMNMSNRSFSPKIHRRFFSSFSTSTDFPWNTAVLDSSDSSNSLCVHEMRGVGLALKMSLSQTGKMEGANRAICDPIGARNMLEKLIQVWAWRLQGLNTQLLKPNICFGRHKPHPFVIKTHNHKLLILPFNNPPSQRVVQNKCFAQPILDYLNWIKPSHFLVVLVHHQHRNLNSQAALVVDVRHLFHVA
nr:hypothetical protein Iba_scaffold31193CG0080 [Ipomoea batatas]GMC80640.1 hypothetical protein Iba_chr04aCG22240 [Ipomoea batatas]